MRSDQKVRQSFTNADIYQKYWQKMENIEVMSKSQQLSEFQSQLPTELSNFAVETLKQDEKS